MIFAMLDCGVTRLRLALLAAIVGFTGAGWPRVEARVSTMFESSVRPETFEAAALARALPPSLAPHFEPGLRLVALVASDIDADGDLDLVANDGSLDLLVWINDGTQYLQRRLARRTGGWRQNASTANDAGVLDTVSAIVTARALVRPGHALRLRLSANGTFRPRSDSRASDPLFARSQGPRAPPLVPFSI